MDGAPARLKTKPVSAVKRIRNGLFLEVGYESDLDAVSIAAIHGVTLICTRV
jgi:hypothetical protein